MTRHLPLLRRYGPAAAIVLAVVSVMAVVVGLVIVAMNKPLPQERRAVQQVTVIRPPPPPPEEAPPPPPEVKEEVKLPDPEPVEENNAAPPPGDLGLDAEGVAGADAFGLAARKGGRDLLADSGGGFDWYKNAVGSELVGRLSENQDIRRKRYSVTLRLWLASDGHIERLHMEGTTGDKDLDKRLMAALEELGRISEPPPQGLPQPVHLRIVNRI